MGYKQPLHINSQKFSSTANTDTATITKPTGLAVNDVMVAFFLTALDAITAPSGWTQFDTDDAANVRSVLFYKVATSGDVAATSFTFTAASALGPFCGGISAYRYVDTSNPVNVANQTVSSLTFTSPAGITTPSVTTTQTSTLVHYLGFRQDATTIATYSVPAGYTSRQSSGFGNHGNTKAYSMVWCDKGSVDTVGSNAGIVITATGTSLDNYIARTVALQALPLNSTDSATGADTGSVAIQVAKNSSDAVSGTDFVPAPIQVGNVDLEHANDLNSIVATPPPIAPETLTTTEMFAIVIKDSDTVMGVSETGVVNDQNHPINRETGTTNEFFSIVATYTGPADRWIGTEYAASPAGSSPTVIRDYKATLIMGPADVYVADFGAIEPIGLGVTIAPPSAYWTHLGGIYKGVQLHVEHEWEEFLPKNISDRGTRRLKKRRLSAAMELAEPTLDNILLGVDNGSITSGVGYRTYTPPATVDRATPLTYKAIIVHGWAPGLRPDGTQKRRMIIMRKCLSIESIAMTYSKTDQTTVPITWAVHRVSNSVAPFVIIDET